MIEKTVVTEEAIKFEWGRDFAPYIPKMMLLPLVNRNMGAAFIMQELEYRFYKNPEGFYVFYEPQPKQPHYYLGFSWSEKFHISVTRFKTAFDKIGVRYSSYREFAESEDKFRNKYYLSFYDRSRKQVYYLRNNELVTADIKKVFGETTIGMIFEGFYHLRNEAMEETFKEVERRKASGEALTLDLLIATL